MRLSIRWVFRRIFVLNSYLRFIGDVEDRLPGGGFTEVVRSPWGNFDLLATRDARRWGINCRQGELSAINVRDIGAALVAAATADPAFSHFVLVLVCDRPQAKSSYEAARSARMRLVVCDENFEESMKSLVI